MWLFTKVGFFSAVLRDEGELLKPVAEQVLMVRARVREDLDLLRKHYAPKLGPTLEWPGRDYPYRGLITKRDWAEALAKAALDLDYENFKSKVAKTQGYDRAHLYGAVWGVMNGAEQKLGARVKKAGEKARQAHLSLEDEKPTRRLEARKHAHAKAAQFQRLNEVKVTYRREDCPTCEGVGLVAMDGPAGVPHTVTCPHCKELA